MLPVLPGTWLADAETRRRNQHAVLLAVVALVGTLFTGLFLALSQLGAVIGAIGLGGLILLASAAAGAALGFLFSVPRVLSTTDDAPIAPEGKKASSKTPLMSSNTNLERISEWLTTMIVGVGLSQITSVDEYVRAFTAFLAVRSTPTLAAAGPFILTVGLVSGFVFLYLYTRLFLSSLFLHVEQMINRIGLQELPKENDRIRMIAQELAERDGTSMMKYIASVDQLSFDHTMYVLNALLYEPEGYKKVLDIGEDLEDTAAVRMARYWFIMAAAHGQRHHALLMAEASDLERAEARAETLNACRRAVALDPAYKQRLRALSIPGSSRDDLKDFSKDAGFKKIVGGGRS